MMLLRNWKLTLSLSGCQVFRLIGVLRQIKTNPVDPTLGGIRSLVFDLAVAAVPSALIVTLTHALVFHLGDKVIMDN